MTERSESPTESDEENEKNIGKTEEDQVDEGSEGDAIEEVCNAAVRSFVDEMNTIAAGFSLKNTNFDNPHGLQNKRNKSTAFDVAQISRQAMQDELFRQIVATKVHECCLLQTDLSLRPVKWENTNKLLTDGYNGIKTGITNAAGPCLTCELTSEGKTLICVLLNCKSQDARFVEMAKIMRWGLRFFDDFGKKTDCV